MGARSRKSLRDWCLQFIPVTSCECGHCHYLLPRRFPNKMLTPQTSQPNLKATPLKEVTKWLEEGFQGKAWWTPVTVAELQHSLTCFRDWMKQRRREEGFPPCRRKIPKCSTRLHKSNRAADDTSILQAENLQPFPVRLPTATRLRRSMQSSRAFWIQVWAAFWD